ncbi:MAG TPA: ribosome recycling factor [Nitrospiraceae bacterium]|nr:ribosome recycling factor [Nitrospiraceae bacterium]
MVSEIKKKSEEKMGKALEMLKREYAAIRTGRASLGILDGISVDYYGTPTPLNQVANLAIPEPRLITLQPWDPKMVGDIEKAIMKSDLGLTPSNDGKLIRLAIPPLTEERRQQIVKQAKKLAEESRVAVRNIRRDINDEIKKKGKESHLSEDDTKRAQEETQKLTDSFIKKIDDLLAHKDKEIMTV